MNEIQALEEYFYQLIANLAAIGPNNASGNVFFTAVNDNDLMQLENNMGIPQGRMACIYITPNGSISMTNANARRSHEVELLIIGTYDTGSTASRQDVLNRADNICLSIISHFTKIKTQGIIPAASELIRNIDLDNIKIDILRSFGNGYIGKSITLKITTIASAQYIPTAWASPIL